ncbi:tape measure protein [Cohnella silvisoli]|uniref:Tape measure protein n=1 Tax=Cohnella silvisoli TaxID=2873699 RepID=A0ABV1L324_9BACL|nr:tape measure protein [Cohnella silvisoli]MCD9026052.1 tape measure protein [Cohnella silvisoli]
MPTVSASLQLFDRFSQVLNKAHQGMERVLSAADRVKQQIEQPVRMAIDVQGVFAELQHIQNRIATTGSSALHVILDAGSIAQGMTEIQQRIRSGLTDNVVGVTLDPSNAIQEAPAIRQHLEQAVGQLETKIKFDIPVDEEIRNRIHSLFAGVAPSVTVRLLFDPNYAYRDINDTVQRLAAAQATLHLSLDASEALAEVERLKQQISATGSSALHIIIDADAVTRTLSQIQNRLRSSGVKIIFDTSTIQADAQRVREMVLSKLGEIRMRIQVQLPTSLTVMFTNIQRLVMRLLVAVRQLSRTSTGTAQLEAALERIRRLEERINQLQQQHNQRLREGGSASSGLLSNLKGIAAAYLSIATLHKAIDLVNWADAIASVNTRLSMINDGTQTQLELQRKVMAVANDTRQAYRETASMVAQLGASTQGVFKNDNEILAFSSRFNKLLITGGASAEDSKNAILQMTQALSSGVLQGDELRSLSETAPMLMKVLADGLGVSRGSLKKLGADGKLTSSAIVQAFSKQDAYINKIFRNMPVTFGQAMTLAKNKAAGWISTLNSADGPIRRLTKSLMKMVDWMDSAQGQSFLNGLSVGINIVADGIAAFTDLIVNNMDIVKNVLIAIGVVVLGLAAYWLIMWAIATWPVLAIIGAIALLLIGLNRLGVSTKQVVGLVAGYFNAAFAQIFNKVAFIWNIFLSFAEFLVNVFIDPVYAVKKLFYDMLKEVSGFFDSMIGGIVKGLNWAIDQLNWVSGSNLDHIGGLDNSWVETLKPKKSDKDVVDLSKYKLDYKDVAKAFEDGRKKGEDVFSKAADKINDLNQVGDAWASGNINKVNEVGKINDKVDISSEDLKTMRELAEMKNIQNFVTLQPKTTVNVKTGPVSKEADLDSIIAGVTEHLEVAIVTSAEGVYSG